MGADDDWKDKAFRIDPYCFAANPGDPSEAFYPQFWQLLRDNDVPFGVHWDKDPAVRSRRPPL